MRQSLITSQGSNELSFHPTIELPINFSAILTFRLTHAVFDSRRKDGESLAGGKVWIPALSTNVARGPGVSLSLKTDTQG
jgi:hypothetical protein